jgi:hypothetical protein
MGSDCYITVGPTTDDSYWIWKDEYQVWVWNGPEFQGDYQGHPYSYWHGRHEGGGDRSHRPGKGESSEGEHPVNKDNVEQSKGIEPRVEFDRSKEPPPQAESCRDKAWWTCKSSGKDAKLQEKFGYGASELVGVGDIPNRLKTFSFSALI